MTQQDILNALSHVQEPDLRKDLCDTEYGSGY
jgi:hypothetical protein